MSHPTVFWEEPYIAAIYETDDANMAGRILEATSAIEQRLLSPVEPGSEEDRAIKMLKAGLRLYGPNAVRRSQTAAATATVIPQ
jgi:hypothetical protein